MPLAVARDWIEHNQLWPLLDGLDELRRVDETENAMDEELDRKRQARQIQCMRAINTFLDLHPGISTIVCCRHLEYEALEARGEHLECLKGAIYLQALDDDQIKNYLLKYKYLPSWDTLKNQTKLLKLARFPLFFLCLVVAYSGQPIQKPEELLDIYIENQLNDLGTQGAYPHGKAPSKAQTHHYLAWLATKLEKQEVTEFLIERLQPNWLDRKRDLRFYRLSVVLLYGLLYGPFLGLFFGLGVGVSEGLETGLIFGLILGLVLGLSDEIRVGPISQSRVRPISGQMNIEPVENLNFSWQEASSALIGLLFFGLLLVPSIGLFFGLFGALFLGLFFGLFAGLSASESEIDDKQLPNQGIRTSTKNGLMFGLSVGLILGSFFGLFFGLGGGLGSGLFFGLFGALFLGLFFGLGVGLDVVIRHFCLRFVLYRSGTAPWNYAKFLEHAENHRFVQRVGGRYRFVHDLLRKRFAARYQPRYR